MPDGSLDPNDSWRKIRPVAVVVVRRDDEILCFPDGIEAIVDEVTSGAASAR